MKTTEEGIVLRKVLEVPCRSLMSEMSTCRIVSNDQIGNEMCRAISFHEYQSKEHRNAACVLFQDEFKDKCLVFYIFVTTYL